MVGPPGLEPGTSRLSVERPSQLSYGPILYMVNVVNKSVVCKLFIIFIN